MGWGVRRVRARRPAAWESGQKREQVEFFALSLSSFLSSSERYNKSQPCSPSSPPASRRPPWSGAWPELERARRGVAGGGPGVAGDREVGAPAPSAKKSEERATRHAWGACGSPAAHPTPPPVHRPTSPGRRLASPRLKKAPHSRITPPLSKNRPARHARPARAAAVSVREKERETPPAAHPFRTCTSTGLWWLARPERGARREAKARPGRAPPANLLAL